METSSYLSFLVIGIFSLIFFQSSQASDSINASQNIRDGETLVSSQGTFELGFFSPGSSGNRYLGIWYRNISVQTIVWVANREVPIANTTGVILNVIEPGILVLANSTNGLIWSSILSRTVSNPVAQLLDSGNLVLRDAGDNRTENYAWQSFDYPADTYLSGMRIGQNLVTGLETKLLSWRSVDDPAPGDVSYQLDPTGFPQIIVKRGDVVYHRMGPWNGLIFSGASSYITDGLNFVMNGDEMSHGISFGISVLSRFNVNQSGLVQHWTWQNQREWVSYISMPRDICDTYGTCGANTICDIENSSPCRCLDEFVPRDLEAWVRRGNRTNGCVRRRNLNCETDVFVRHFGIKLPDSRYSWHNTSMTLDECRDECLRNCSCTAYTRLDIRRMSGCLIWYRELIDMAVSSSGQEIYVRVASSDERFEGRNRQILIASLVSVTGIIFIGLSIFIYTRKRKHSLNVKGGKSITLTELYDGSYQKDPDLPLFGLSTILTATNNFALSNKIGEGGFGSVYKGILKGGQEIAVKRLSKDSTQGLDEFKNEIISIAKLQHRNLVRLLGCCIHGEESMLVYEYMPNKSQDFHLFDQTKRLLLDWPKRFYIINGIARGLLYLHQDSRLRIIHRDLKARNVLLDSEMNPKISDFGLARSFVGNETEAKTRRVVGTYGYMSPEYAVAGLFSVKSDVFSFGVLLLEIISGEKNRYFAHSDNSFNLLGHAWTLYKERRSLELVETCLIDSLHFVEVERSIHVALLCVQQNPEDRPSISLVVQMLSNESVLLSKPNQPGFFTERGVFSSNDIDAKWSINEMTITMPQGR